MWKIASVLVFMAVASASLVAAEYLRQQLPAFANLLTVVGLSTLAAAVLILLTMLDSRRGSAWIRLDWFLPAIRRVESQASSISHSALARWLRRWVPASWQSNWRTKQRGPIRKSLRQLGVSWAAAPLRRLVQGLCLLIFALLFFYVCWPYSARPNIETQAWPDHYAQNLANKEWIPAETFLMIDPLVSLSTAIASRSWVYSLVSAAAILIVCILIPRGFCGYLCPLGTTIDLFDWAIGRHVTKFRIAGDGWWVHIKYYLLVGTLISALFGVLISGFFAAIPVITRGMLFVFDPLQSGLARGWHLVPGANLGQWLSIAMFAAVLGLGFLRPRFWCKYVCPSGAVFSLANVFRATERKVESSCINCNKCVEVCPFDAIKPDFTTRVTDCTLCQTCGGVCPTHAIKFVERGNRVELKVLNDPPTHETALGRRGFLSLAAGSSIAMVGGSVAATATRAFGASLDDASAVRPVRPPGSVPEQEFLQMCIRCGECFKACPNNVLQPEGFLQGLEGLWSPLVNADWAGCESSCNACGQVCPTGAIRALPLEEKRVARMGLAVLNESTCLPLAGIEDCDLCVQECNAAGYKAIEYRHVGAQTDASGQPLEGTGFLAPIVLAESCVGCGLCQTRCHAINVKERQVLSNSAIIVEAGPGKEDRLMEGSYVELREQERRDRMAEKERQAGSEYFVPDAASTATEPQTDPFGLGTPEQEDPFGVGPAEDPAEDPDPFGIQ